MNRIKEKNKYSKEKQDTYNEIRHQAEEKKRCVEQHSKSDFVVNDGVKNEISQLEDKLKSATRTQGKVIRDKLQVLTKDKDNFRRTIQVIEEKIQGLEAKIKRLNDQIWRVSLKVGIIGRDLTNEYWFFKDEPTRLYVKDITQNVWGYYNDEESIIELENSLISKGIREKRLIDGIKKIKGKLKMK